MGDMDSRSSYVPGMTPELLLGLPCRRAESLNLPWDKQSAVIGRSKCPKLFLVRVTHHEDSRVTQPELFCGQGEPRRFLGHTPKIPCFPSANNRYKDLRTTCTEVDRGDGQGSNKEERMLNTKGSHLRGSKERRKNWAPQSAMETQAKNCYKIIFPWGPASKDREEILGFSSNGKLEGSVIIIGTRAEVCTGVESEEMGTAAVDCLFKKTWP